MWQVEPGPEEAESWLRGVVGGEGGGVKGASVEIVCSDGTSETLETGSSSNNGADEGGNEGRNGGDGGGAAGGSAAVAVVAADAGVLHLGVGVEGVVAALAAVAVAASALVAGEQVQASLKRRCSKRFDSV